MKRLNKIYVFHEYGAVNHYRALNWYITNQDDYEIVYREFSLLRKFVKGVITFDLELIKKQFVNLAFIIGLLFSSKNTIIVGIAPYDYRLAIFLPLLNRHKYFYHTSNTYWDYSIYPKRLFANTRILKGIWKQFIENATGVFCVTKKAANGIKSYYNVSNVVVVNHSIISAYNLEFDEIKFLVHQKRINCLYSGRITQAKGIAIIFKLVESLSKEHFSFTFVGDGDMKQELLEFIKNKSNCSYLGFIKNPELIEVYKNADVLLQPSLKTQKWEELFGMSIIEGMACATIPITTNHSGPIEIIKHEKTGFLFSEQDYLNETIKILESFVVDNDQMIQIKKAAYIESKKYRAENIFKKWNEYLHI
tara:strand:+ start:38062 stop:39150 length:1089 start_codon:yes stop_codon:yes gene_type:complete